MASKVYVAIMGCAKEDYEDINIVGQSVLDNLYGTWASLFASPPKDKDAFSEQLGKSVAAQSKAKESGGKLDIADRNKESGLLFDMLNVDLKSYVNNLYRDNKVNLEKSGLRVSKEPTPHAIPFAPSCKKVINGLEANTIKFLLSKIQKPAGQGREHLTFIVYMTTDPESLENLKQVCKTTNSKKLIAKNVPRGVDLYYYITAMNAAGESDYSERIRYMLN
jgi:hypothetical protein